MCASYFVPMPASPPRASAPGASVRRETPRAALGTRKHQNQRSRGSTRAGAALSHKGAPRPTTEQSEPRRSAACASGSRHGPRRRRRGAYRPEADHGGAARRLPGRAGPPRRQVVLFCGAAQARGLRGRPTPAWNHMSRWHSSVATQVKFAQKQAALQAKNAKPDKKVTDFVRRIRRVLDKKSREHGGTEGTYLREYDLGVLRCRGAFPALDGLVSISP